jgi:hypothetical protein
LILYVKLYSLEFHVVSISHLQNLFIFPCSIGIFTKIKCKLLVKVFTITMIESCLLIVTDNTAMKSIKMTSHFDYIIGYSCNKLTSCQWLTFTCWNSMHLSTYSSTCFFIPFQKNSAFKSMYIFLILR